MNNPTLVNALNGIAIAAANNGDIATVAMLEQVAQEVSSIVPTNRAGTLAVTAYDATASSTTAFLVFSGLTTNVTGASGAASPMYDSLQKVQKQSGIAPQSLGA